MRILIVIPFSQIPAAGPAYIAAVLLKAGHEVRGLIYEDPAQLRQHLVCDILMTGGLSCQWSIIENILKIAKEYNIPTVLGGGIVTAEPEIVVNALQPTYAVLGQGEETIVELTYCIERNIIYPKIKGIAYIKNGLFVKTDKRSDIKNLDSLPFPNYEIFNLSKTINKFNLTQLDYLTLWDSPREYPLVASRSCPFHCTFCWHTSGDRYSRRSVSSVIKELEEAIKKYNINVVSILDELFGTSEEWLFSFCKEISKLKEQYDFEWWCCLRASQATEFLLEKLKQSGCFMVSYGFESFDQTVLDSMKKRIKVSDIEKAYILTKKAGLAIMAQFIFGDPAETEVSIKKSLNFWKDHSDIYITTIWLCPDSPLYRLAISRGIIKNKLQHQKNCFKLYNLTKLSDIQWQKFSLHILKLNILNVPWPWIKQTRGIIYVKCPHCKTLQKYENLYIAWKVRIICRNCKSRFFISKNWQKLLLKVIARLTPNWAWIYRLWENLTKNNA